MLDVPFDWCTKEMALMLGENLGLLVVTDVSSDSFKLRLSFDVYRGVLYGQGWNGNSCFNMRSCLISALSMVG